MAKRMELFVASPLAGGLCHSTYKQSQFALMRACMDYGITVTFKDLANQSDIRFARNKLANAALWEQTPTHVLFWDGDIGIQAEHILDLVRADKEVVTAPCPKKEINWEFVKAAVLRNPNITAEQLEGAGANLCFNRQMVGYDSEPVYLDRPMDVKENGAGVMLIQREVFEHLIEAYPDDWYYENRQEPRGRKVYDFFPTGPDKESRTYQFEDYGFCLKWQSIGGKVYMLPWIKTTHAGMAVFRGNLPDMVEALMAPEEELLAQAE